MYNIMYDILAIHYLYQLPCFMRSLAPLHRVVARQIFQVPSNLSPISPPITLNYISALSAPLRIRRQAYAFSAARSPSPPTGSKWNTRFLKLGLAAVVGASALWWDENYNARTLSRNFRTIWHGAAIALDYKFVRLLL